MEVQAHSVLILLILFREFMPLQYEDSDSIFLEAFPNVVCQGYISFQVYVSPPLENANAYNWTFQSDNTTVTTFLPEVYLNIPNNAPVGVWEICMVAYSGCDTTEMSHCTQVEIVERFQVIKDQQGFCEDTFPFLWGALIIPSPGVYSQTFTDIHGCNTDSSWTVFSYSPVVFNLDTIVCETSFNFDGINYTSSGSYSYSWPGNLECDTAVIINLWLGGIDVFVELNCVNDSIELQPLLLFRDELVPGPAYTWYDCMFSELLSIEQNFVIDSGCYCVIIENLFCIDTICMTYSESPCGTICSIGQDTACIGEEVILSTTDTFSANTIFHWAIEKAEMDNRYFTGNDSVILQFTEPGYYYLSLTITTDSNSTTCHDSIFVRDPFLTASICCEQPTCDSCTSMLFFLTRVSPWTVVISDGILLDTIENFQSSPYAYIVCSE